MKKFYILILIALVGVMPISCTKQLEVSSPSTVDADFVFSSIETGKTVMLGAYDSFISNYNNGYVPNWENIGSDTERCSVGNVTFLIGGAELYLAPYTPEDFNINFMKGNWATFYSIIAKCNQVISNVEAFSNYDEIVKTAPNDWSDLLGQAYCLRATVYYDMARYFGDVVYVDEPGTNVTELSSRDYIIEKELAHVIAAEPLMYKVGENSHYTDQMTRNYADGLIGRLCFMEAGYQTRRTDFATDFYKDAEGKTLTIDVWGTDEARKAAYGRRTDWKKFYEKALPYLQKAVENPGEVALTTVDPRSDAQGRVYSNPFAYYFYQVNGQVMANETVYEISMKAEGGGSRIAYNFGRGSNGGGNAYPPKSNAQISTYPEVLYDVFDPLDQRRDASVTVTGSTGKGVERINTFALTNKSDGGICMNKYDLNRQLNPDSRQLYSGINYILMRQADVILMLAECYAQTGNDGSAQTYLKQISDRAFSNQSEAVKTAKFNELLADAGSTLEAIYAERKLEFVGESLRRWDLIRTGKMPQVAVEHRAKLVKEMKELKTNGYVQYANGNQYPAWIWTKTVNAKDILGYRLTTATPAGTDDSSLKGSLLIPGFRGQHDDWAAVAAEDASKTVIVTDNTNLAIKGLFKYIDPSSAEAAALEADGWVKTPWGAGSYTTGAKGLEENSNTEAEWSSKFMGGYSDSDYAAKKAPIYLIPYEYNVCVTTNLVNGYGFKSVAN